MKRMAFFIITVMLASVISCGSSDQKKDESIVLIKTDFGEMKVKLYDDTPEHKQNFIKLAEEGFYNNLMFHRIINNFMIQGGDPNSREENPNILLGGGGPGYTIPAEILPHHIHKKGVLAAARTGGASNPEKRSSGSQFYIIMGEIFTQSKLDTLEMKINANKKNALVKEQYNLATNELKMFKENNDREGFDAKIDELRLKADSIFEAGGKVIFTEKQREIYTTIGGYPSLDGEYTVFGEVIEGLEVIDKIAGVETGNRDRPKVDVRMQVELVK